jgi:hypothetical protein
MAPSLLSKRRLSKKATFLPREGNGYREGTEKDGILKCEDDAC